METKLPALVPILLLAAAAVSIYSFATFDRLVKAEYELHREAWTADGRPRGFFWRAPECTWFDSSMALHRLVLSWLFTTPAWAAQSSRHRALLRRLRISVFAWNIALIGAIIMIVRTLS